MAGTPKTLHKSASVRRLIDDLTNNFALRHHIDICVVIETLVSSEVEPDFGKITGNAHWIRMDR